MNVIYATPFNNSLRTIITSATIKDLPVNGLFQTSTLAQMVGVSRAGRDWAVS
ncbi:MAG: hypothetical protein ACI9OJ_005542 [Myxococcota bacterium]